MALHIYFVWYILIARLKQYGWILRKDIRFSFYSHALCEGGDILEH